MEKIKQIFMENVYPNKKNSQLFGSFLFLISYDIPFFISIQFLKKSLTKS